MAQQKQLYDIQGVPIKVGSLVAHVGELGCGLVKHRVLAIDTSSQWRFQINTEAGPWCPDEVVVLEEPVWPNS